MSNQSSQTRVSTGSNSRQVLVSRPRRASDDSFSSAPPPPPGPIMQVGNPLGNLPLLVPNAFALGPPPPAAQGGAIRLGPGAYRFGGNPPPPPPPPPPQGMKTGGKVRKTNVYLLHKGEVVVPASRVKAVDKALKKSGMKPLKK